MSNFSLTDILKLLKSKQYAEQAGPDDVLILGIKERPSLTGVASPLPFAQVKLLKVKDLADTQDCQVVNVPTDQLSFAGVFRNKTFTDDGCFENFRRLKSLNPDLTITENGDFIDFDMDAETNTGQNVGGQVEVYKQKLGQILQFRTVESSNGSITITQNADTIDIIVNAGAGQVTSVNGLTGIVVLDADDISDATTTNKFVTATDITKLGFITVTQAVNLDTMESDIASLAVDVAINNTKVTNATHTGDVTGSGALTVDPTAISGKPAVTAASGMEILANDAGVLKKIDAADFLSSIPTVTDDATRDATYPSPANGFQVYNEFQSVIETYNSTYDLWLHPGIVVGVEDTTIQAVTIRKIAFISPTAAGIGGVEFPIVDFASSSGERNVSNGVITRLGAATGNPNQTYIAIANAGKYYVDYSGAVTIGDSVYSTTNTTGLALSGTFSQTGTIGQAIQNGGSNPSFPSSVLVSLQNKN